MRQVSLVPAVSLCIATLALAGSAGAVSTGGYQGGGNGMDLRPIAEGCLCYGYGTGYNAGVDDQGNFWVHHDIVDNVGHYGPPTAAGPVIGDLAANRWLDAWGNAEQGSLDVHSNGGGWVHAPGPGEGGLAGQDFGLFDVDVHADRDNGTNVQVGNGMWGSLTNHYAHLCAQGSPNGGPGTLGANAGLDAQGLPPIGAGAGNCGFKPGP